MNVVDVTGVSISTYGGLYHPSGAIRGRTAPTTLSGLQAPDGSYYFLGLFSPLNLFSAGEQGAWYDPSDFSTMFQDSAGTTPVTAVEQPVGLILDKSKGLALGSELVTNGTFDTGITGWTKGAGTTAPLSWDSTGKRLLVTNDLAYFANGTQTISGLTVGKSYLVTAAISDSTVDARIQINGLAGATSATFPPGGGAARFVFTATATSHVLVAQNNQSTLGGVAYWDNISLKEIAGNHASQSTSASRPVLSARVNLLTYSEQFDNAAWTKATGVAISANAGAAPDGSNTADKLYASSSGSNRFLYQTLTLASGLYRWSLRAKAAEKSIVYIDLTGAGTTQVFFNLSTGLVGTVAAGYTASDPVSLGNGWYECSVTNNSSAAYSFGGVYGVADANGSTAVTANGTDGVYIWGADLRVTNDGVGIPAYQRVAAATDYDTSGFPLYLRFDGTDDSLATASIDFSATDKMSVFAGVRKLSDAAAGVVTELSSNINSNNGAFIFAPGSYTTATGSLYHASSKGTVIAPLNSTTTFASPITNVISALFDIAGDKNTIRINGLQNAQSTDDQGTGNYGNYLLYIGRRGGSTLPYNGRLYSLIVRGAQSTDAQIASTETWVNNVTKGY